MSRLPGMIEAVAPTEAIRKSYDLSSRFYGVLAAPFERKPRQLGLLLILPFAVNCAVAMAGIYPFGHGESVVTPTLISSSFALHDARGTEASFVGCTPAAVSVSRRLI